ncbi:MULTISPECIES: glycosyltransferase family 4 protein [Bradyrhizobium]|uniref:glycosyltransferase family 4 protein n=1 Tax=Bradyrhizobium TaxID=374 RepID=UPI0004B4D49D|nr:MULTISPECIES: glycosyltransferase family 4 protein [Bradyrhizobium]BBO04188.1 hypothetical protein SG09_35380 [Bradyrhizobium ottawaense]GMO46132.1 hypothetical protein BwSF21_62240 [Bradyrhizobium ottawaense]
MRLVVVASNWPFPGHTVRAANVVVFELTRALAAQTAMTIGFLRVGLEGEPRPDADEIAGLAALAEVGVEILPEIILPVRKTQGSPFIKLLDPKPEHFYPYVDQGGAIARALASWNADALMVPWSEWLTAACSTVPVLKFAYYGNPDHKTGYMRAMHDRKLNGWNPGYLRLRLGLSRLEQVHNQIMLRYEILGDVAANDAAYYAQRGHPNAFYIQNVWIDRFGEGWRERRRALEQPSPLVIIGNVGKLGGTANRYGLDYLGREVLPELRKRMAPGTFRIEILGSGELEPGIRAPLEGPDVVFRGFVPDIDEAMLAAHVFLCTNNATPFKVGHTRYLHAWTLGSCVIAHRDVSLSMPEIRHGENALLGCDASDIADLIARAGQDHALRNQIGSAGWETYLTKFRAETVAARIAEQLRSH